MSLGQCQRMPTALQFWLSSYWITKNNNPFITFILTIDIGHKITLYRLIFSLDKKYERGNYPQCSKKGCMTRALVYRFLSIKPPHGIADLGLKDTQSTSTAEYSSE